MASINNTRSTKIQELRGLATIAVVFIHTTPGGMAQVICRPFLNFSVGIFPFSWTIYQSMSATDQAAISPRLLRY